MRADAGNDQEHHVKHSDRQRDAQHTPRAMRMRVSAVRVHVIRIAQARVARTLLSPSLARNLIS
jgi:hypothetical protein